MDRAYTSPSRSASRLPERSERRSPPLPAHRAIRRTALAQEPHPEARCLPSTNPPRDRRAPASWDPRRPAVFAPIPRPVGASGPPAVSLLRCSLPSGHPRRARAPRRSRTAARERAGRGSGDTHPARRRRRVWHRSSSQVEDRFAHAFEAPSCHGALLGRLIIWLAGPSQRSGQPQPAARTLLILARVQVLRRTERRRSRTYPATGYAASPVLKVCYGRPI